jgi:hypothetical protein
MPKGFAGLTRYHDPVALPPTYSEGMSGPVTSDECRLLRRARGDRPVHWQGGEER